MRIVTTKFLNQNVRVYVVDVESGTYYKGVITEVDRLGVLLVTNDGRKTYYLPFTNIIAISLER